MITYDETIDPRDPKVWTTLVEMRDIAQEAAKNLPQEEREMTLAERVIMTRLSAAMGSYALATAAAQGFIQLRLLNELRFVTEVIVDMAFMLGRGLLPLEDFDNVPEWIDKED